MRKLITKSILLLFLGITIISCSKDDDEFTKPTQKEETEKEEVSGPKIVSSIPAEGSKEVDPATDITITFNTAVEIVPEGYVLSTNEINGGKINSKYHTNFEVTKFNDLWEKTIVKKSFLLSEDGKTLTIPKSILFYNGSVDRPYNFDLRGVHTLHMNNAVRDPVTKEFSKAKISFSIKKFQYGYYHERKDNQYVEPDNWNSKWKDQTLSDFHLNNIREGKKRTNYAYAKALDLTGDDIRIGIYDQAIAPESIEYQAVIYSNVYYPSNKYLIPTYFQTGSHGLRMARYMLDYAPKVNLLELNKSDYLLGMEGIEDFTKLWSEMGNLNLDVFSSSGSWGTNNNMQKNVSDLVKQGVIVNRSAGNESWMKNTIASHKWKEVFTPYIEDFSKHDGAFVVVQAAIADGVYSSIRSQLGITKHYGITVVESGVGATSQATATFSSICALLLEYNKKHSKGFTPQEVVATLFETATDIGESGVDEVFGHGLVNIEAALKRLEQGVKPTLNPYANLDEDTKEKVKALPDSK